MSYTGDVTVGGPADVRELPGLTISKVAVGPMNNNAYLLRCTSTGHAPWTVVEGTEAATLLGLLGGAAGADRYHPPAPGPLGGAGRVQQATGAPTVAHHDDAASHRRAHR